MNKLRDLTPLEFGYARSYLRKQKIRRFFIIIIGIALILTGCAIFTAFQIKKNTNLSSILPLFILILLFILCGIVFILYGLKRKYILLKEAYILNGIPKKRTIRLMGIGNYKYQIADNLVILPPGAEYVFELNTKKHIQTTVAIIKCSNPISLFGIFSEQPKIALVLEYRNSIRVHHALKKYGKNMFRNYNIRKTLFILLAILVLSSEMYYIYKNPIQDKQTGFFIIGALIFCPIIVFTILYFLLKHFAKILGFNNISYEEKLKG